MNLKAKTVGVLVTVLALFAMLQYSQAAPEATPAPGKIGVVSIRTVFNASNRHKQYRSQVLQAQSRARAQVEDMAKEIEAEEAGLKALKEGTPDYMKQLQMILRKRADLDGRREYIKQERSLEDKNWMEGLYQETLKIVQAVAKEKGLSLIFERTEPEFPVSSEELMMTFSTHKVLYAEGCVDLTQEVTARLDAVGSASSQP